MGAWVEAFEKSTSVADIPGAIAQVEKRFYFWTRMAIGIVLLGVLTMNSTSQPRLIAAGLFVAITGMGAGRADENLGPH